MGFLPVLRPASWDGPSRGALAHLWLGTAAQPQVVVGYRDDADVELWATADHDDRSEADEIVRQAFANLEQLEVGFELVESETAKIVVGAGHPATSEKVLSEPFMLDVHRALDASQVAVSLAVRGTILACAFDGTTAAWSTMIGLHREAWDRGPEEERLTEQLVLFEDGRKVRAFDPVCRT